MSWQDLIFFAGSLVFVIALVPALRASEKPPTSTSVTTATVLAVFALTYGTMQFWFSAAITTITAACWAALAIQRSRS